MEVVPMRRVLWVLPALLLGLAAPTHASPLVVHAGESVTFNFDFVASSIDPPPPYLAISFYTGLPFASIGPDDFGLWTGHSELDGGGTQIFGPYGANLLALLLTDGAVDGVFSMTLSVITGSITADPYAHVWINNNELGPGPVSGVPSAAAAAVPEPATLTLLGAGLAAGAWRRRRTL